MIVPGSSLYECKQHTDDHLQLSLARANESSIATRAPCSCAQFREISLTSRTPGMSRTVSLVPILWVQYTETEAKWYSYGRKSQSFRVLRSLRRCNRYCASMVRHAFTSSPRQHLMTMCIFRRDLAGEDQVLKNEVKALGGPINDLAWDSESKRILVGGDGRDRFAHAFTFDTGSSVGELVSNIDCSAS